jgi:3-deoxy-D-manno-octulosonic-acid transferase
VPEVARIPGFWAWSALNPPLPQDAQARALPAPRHSILLHATDPGHLTALQVLALQWRERRDACPVHVTGPGPNPERLLDAHAPALVALAGPVLPPRMIATAQARGIGLMLMDTAQINAPGLWRHWPGMTRALLQGFAGLHAPDAAAAQYLTRVSAGRIPVHVTGALARNGPAAPCNEAERAALADQIGTRPLWFAQDTAATEIATVLSGHAHALRAAHRLLLIVMPAQIELGPEIARQARAMGFETALRSIDEDLVETTQVYVADGGDPAGLFLRLAPVCFLGGTLDPGALQADPLEASALGSAIVCGATRHRATPALLQELVNTGATLRAGSAMELGDAVARLLSPEVAAGLTLRAWELVTRGALATAQVAQSMADWLKLNPPRPA